jgi:hypothetical protein
MSANVTAPDARPTQSAALLQLLRNAGPEGVSAIEALRWLGIYRVGARIFQLRQAGYVIRTERRNHETAVYHLETARDRVWAGGPELVP